MRLTFDTSSVIALSKPIKGRRRTRINTSAFSRYGRADPKAKPTEKHPDHAPVRHTETSTGKLPDQAPVQHTETPSEPTKKAEAIEDAYRRFAEPLRNLHPVHSERIRFHGPPELWRLAWRKQG